jgi:hypothetical protein
MPEALVPLSRLVGQPVVGPGGARLGQVADVVVRWDGAEPYPLVAGFVLDAGGQETFLPAAQAEVGQAGPVRSSVAGPLGAFVRRAGEMQNKKKKKKDKEIKVREGKIKKKMK